MPVRFARGDVLLATLVFSSGLGAKKRPVLVLRDTGDDDLLVLPITSQAARTSHDVRLADWRDAGLKLPSVVRLEKFATIEKSAVVRRLGALSPDESRRVVDALRVIFAEVLAG